MPRERRGNILQHLERAAQGWWCSLIDIVLDHEDAQKQPDVGDDE
jgi:hypothetical protein